MGRWLAFSLMTGLLLVAGCGGDHGAEGGGDAGAGDGGVVPDQGWRIADIPDVGGGGEGVLPAGDGQGEMGSVDGGLDGGGAADSGPPPGCTKDSDCVGKGDGLKPCQRPVCDRHQGLCVAGPRAPGEPCDDGDSCTVQTACDRFGQCRGPKLFCDDGNFCTTDSCLPDKGCIYQPNDHVCNDGNGCTKADRCQAGSCVGEEQPGCACATDQECQQFDDDDQCNGKVSCVYGTCKVPKSSVKVCPTTGDGPCVRTVCHAASGECEAIVRENGRPCNDGDGCTAGDVCLQGQCASAAPRSCDDSNGCTIDGCLPETGCLNEFSLYPCEDGDSCTVNDGCRYGLCLPGPGNSCDGKSCFPKWPLSCGSADLWSTGGEGATSNIKSYTCSPESFPGPEYAYSFVAPYSGVATFALTGDLAVSRLLLLEGRGRGCEAVNCRATSPGVLSFDMFAGATYYLVVDGVEKGPADYLVELTCQPHNELVCDDGEDDDGDGLTDCLDSDCSSSPVCPAARCAPIWTLSCDSRDFGANYGIGATEAVVSYAAPAENKGCLDNQWLYSGPEFAYRFDAPGSFNVTVRLNNESAQTDLLILEERGEGCNPLDCIAWGLKMVTFPVVAGKSYYFVIDGYQSSAGRFDIEVICPNNIETQCHDGIDNDFDLLADCEDPDCGGALECLGRCRLARSIGCGQSEAFANFGWGSTMAVSSYAGTQWKYPGPEVAYAFKSPFDGAVEVKLELETASTDLLVLDGPGCDPANCVAQGLDKVLFQAKAGNPYAIVVDGYQGAVGTFKIGVTCKAATEAVCGDGEDNDGDGLVDCADEVDCAGTTACPQCLAAYPLECGDHDQWTTATQEATDHIDRFGCSLGVYDGPEFAYYFDAPHSGTVTISLAALEWDQDLFVLADTGLGCNPTNCLTWGTDKVTFEAVKGERYFVVVDGYGQAPAAFGPAFGMGDFELWVECPQ